MKLSNDNIIKTQLRTSLSVLLIASIGMTINIISIPLYTAFFSFEEWGIISLDYVYFNFFLFFGAFSMNIYLFHSNGERRKEVAAKFIYCSWLLIALMGFTYFWPQNECQRLLYMQLGLVSSFAIFVSGLRWGQNRFISQRLWLLLPIIIFHFFAVLDRLYLNSTSFENSFFWTTSAVLLGCLIFLGWSHSDSIKVYTPKILAFSLPMMLNLILTAGLELKMKATLESRLPGHDWSVFSLGIFVYSVHGLLGNNLSPILNAWMKRNIGNLRRIRRKFVFFIIVILASLVVIHITQVLVFSRFNMWYLVYSVGILMWLLSNILSVQLLNSKIIIVFGLVQFIAYMSIKSEFSIGKYILIHFFASFISVIYGFYLFHKALEKSPNNNLVI